MDRSTFLEIKANTTVSLAQNVEWVEIGHGAMQLGGSKASACVDEDYEGPCTILGGNDEYLGTLPNAREAFRAARYAVTPDGGYSSTCVQPAGSEPVNHQTWDDHAFG